MKKILVTIICSIFLFTAMPKPSAQAQIPPKAKAFMVVTGYGTVGGALLGFASMAFGTNSRAIAQGASLGLYAGIIFGTYVLVSHNRSMYPDEYDYPPTEPVPPSPGVMPGYYPGQIPPAPPSGGGFFDSSVNRVNELQERVASFNNKGENSLPPIYLNFLSLSF